MGRKAVSLKNGNNPIIKVSIIGGKTQAFGRSHSYAQTYQFTEIVCLWFPTPDKTYHV